MYDTVPLTEVTVSYLMSPELIHIFEMEFILIHVILNSSIMVLHIYGEMRCFDICKQCTVPESS